MLGCATMYIYSSSSTHFLRFTLSPLILSMILSMKSWGHLADILGTSGTTLGPLWNHSGTTMGPFWEHSGITLRSLWDYSWITLRSLLNTLGPLWGHFGTTLASLLDTLGTLWDHSGITLVAKRTSRVSLVISIDSRQLGARWAPTSGLGGFLTSSFVPSALRPFGPLPPSI